MGPQDGELVGDLELAALEAVLRLYQDPDRLKDELPTIAFLTRTTKETDVHVELSLDGQKGLAVYKPLKGERGNGDVGLRDRAIIVTLLDSRKSE